MKKIAVYLLLLCLNHFPAFSQEGALDNLDDGDFAVMDDTKGLTVTGTPKTTQEMVVVTKDEIEKTGAQDLASLLQETLNLGVTRYGGYGNQADINMRGFDSERVAFLVDGVPVNSPMSGDFDISMIDLNAIESIELIYGGSDSKYNVTGAFGGVINIITTKKQAPGLRITAGISNISTIPGFYYDRDRKKHDPHIEDLFDTQNYSLSAAFGAKKYSIKANAFFNRAANHFLYKDKAFDITRRKEGNEVFDVGGNVSFVALLPDGTSKIIATADIYSADKNIPTSGYSNFHGTQNDFSTKQNIMLDMPRFVTDKIFTEASVSHNWHILEYAPPAAGAQSKHNINYIMAINRWGWDIMDALTFRIGGDYRYVMLNSTDLQQRSRSDGGVYIAFEIKLLKKILIAPSLKGVFDGFSAVPVPKLGLSWQITDAIGIRNNYFRSFKFPDFEDLYWPASGDTEGNPNLKPEDGWGCDLGAAYNITQNANIDAGVFYQWTNDSIHWAPTGGAWKPSNVGEAVFFGADIKAKYKLPLKNNTFNAISFSASYQYLLSYLLSYGYDYASDKRIPYMPSHTVGASVELQWKNDTNKAGSVNIGGHFETLRFAETANLTKLDPYFLLTVNINQKVGKYFSVYGVIRNATNTSYESFDGYPMQGLTVTLGVRYNILINTEDKGVNEYSE